MTVITLFSVSFLILLSAMDGIRTKFASLCRFSKSKNNIIKNKLNKENRLRNGGELYGKTRLEFYADKNRKGEIIAMEENQ